MIVAAAMTDAQLASWQGLLAISRRVPEGWCLVGGQMVQVLCWERDAAPNRPTDDGDAVLDVRAAPDIVRTFTAALVVEGFAPPATSATGLQHRWKRGEAIIDVLIPQSLGPRALIRTVTGGRPIATPGAQNVLVRAERVEVTLPNDEQGAIWRPALQGALLAKAFAYTVPLDLARDRHLVDFAVLATLISVEDSVGTSLSGKERTSSATRSSRRRRRPRRWRSRALPRRLARLRLALVVMRQFAPLRWTALPCPRWDSNPD